jgi:hypothetical protein
VDRATALNYLTNEYAELATDSALSGTPLTTAYNTAIDMSLRQLGYQETDLATTDVPQTQIIGYLALLNYYALKRFARILALRVNVGVAGQLSASRSQAAAQVKALLDDAEKEVVALGFAVGENAVAFSLGRMGLDFLEPNWGEF